MPELRIHRETFITKVKLLFEPLISDIANAPIRSTQMKNVIYITFLLSLDDFRKREIYSRRNESYKWYIELLKHVVESDIAKITESEKDEIIKMLNDKLKVKIYSTIKIIDEIEAINRPRNQKKLVEYMIDFFEIPKQIEDAYIKMRILNNNNNLTINEYMSKVGINSLIERINSIKKKGRFSVAESIIFETFASAKYVAYSSEINQYLMDKMPRYSQYMASKLIV